MSRGSARFGAAVVADGACMAVAAAAGEVPADARGRHAAVHAALSGARWRPMRQRPARSCAAEIERQPGRETAAMPIAGRCHADRATRRSIEPVVLRALPCAGREPALQRIPRLHFSDDGQ